MRLLSAFLVPVVLALAALPVLAAAPIVTPPATASQPAQPAACFDAVGTLSRNFAIGGETTGLILRTDHGNFELSCYGELLRKAESLEGKRVHVIGTLTTLPGTERPDRTVVAVEALSAVDQPNLIPVMPLDQRLSFSAIQR